jgi:hypothetical protein
MRMRALQAIQWRLLLLLLVALGAAVWFTFGCGNAVPTETIATPIPIDVVSETVETQYSAVSFGDAVFQ